MCKFIRLIIDRENSIFKNTQYLSNVIFLYNRYSKYLNDDYAPETTYCNLVELIERTNPFFYVILEAKTGDFAGFVYLDNLIGNSKALHSGEITVCFEQKHWGSFTRKTAICFFDYCFNKLELKKIKAQIYPFNNRVRKLLEFSGFKQDGILRGETLKYGKIEDVEVYSLLKQDLKYIKI